MRIQSVLTLINEMERDGVIDRYAIGGAVAAALYLEPVATLDIDIFVSFRPQPGQLLITPQPLYDYLKPRGATVEGEYLIIAGWPVQFLPPTGALAEEALREAAEMLVAGISTRIFSAEHLAALALETGRPKDMTRVVLFVESGVLHAEKFSGILSRFGLTEKWRTFETRFLS